MGFCEDYQLDLMKMVAALLVFFHSTVTGDVQGKEDRRLNTSSSPVPACLIISLYCLLALSIKVPKGVCMCVYMRVEVRGQYWVSPSITFHYMF